MQYFNKGNSSLSVFHCVYWRFQDRSSARFEKLKKRKGTFLREFRSEPESDLASKKSKRFGEAFSGYFNYSK
jgi:hypothetical protein